MKTILSAVSTAAIFATTASAQFYTPGNLAVLRLGDGIQTLANTGNTGFIDQYTVGGSLVNSLQIPDSGSSALIWNSTATSEGFLTRSTDGSLLTLVGYNTARPAASTVSGTTSATVPRAIGTINAAGTFSLAATTSSQFSGSNIRSGVSDGAGNFWASGGNSGTYYMGTASASATVQSTTANTRVLNIFNGNLYYSTGSGSRGIYGFSDTPASGSTPSLLFTTGGSSSPYDFAINAAGDVVYVADDTASAAGGIQKWTLSGGSWALSYTLGTGAANIGARGLTVDFSGENPIIFATTGESTANRLIEIVDTGSGSSATTLATASTGQIFRGVDFAPTQVPEPGSLLGLGAVALFLNRKLFRRNA